ncbi:formin-like protein 3 [Motacilla alba alba]|uniref:formin-like protein 3 n=1 Tax=Motacilla alba alba TaxID=1094192 RepID=UPI0018D54450|nr:formin-like protein 3 [Motacilla alba alba]
MLGFLQPGTIPPRCHRGASARPGTSALAARGGSAVPPPAPGTAPAAALPLLCSTAGEAPRNKDFRRRRRGDPGLSPPRPRTLPAPAGLARPRPPPPPEPRLQCAGLHAPAPAHVALPPPPRHPPPRVSRSAHPTPPPPPAPRSPAAALRLAPPPRPAHKARTPLRCPPAPLRAALPAPRPHAAPPPRLSLATSARCSSRIHPSCLSAHGSAAVPPRHLGHPPPCPCAPARRMAQPLPARGTDAAPLPPAHRAAVPGRAFLASRGAPQEEEPLPSGHS